MAEAQLDHKHVDHKHVDHKDGHDPDVSDKSSEVAKVVRIEPLRRDGIQLSDHAYQKFSARVPRGTPREALCNPDLWVHVIGKLRMGDEIRIIPDDFAYRAEVLISYTDGKRIRLKPISFVELDDVAPEIDVRHRKNFVLKMRGQQKWCIQRLSDGAWIQELIPTQGEAEAWLDKYLEA